MSKKILQGYQGNDGKIYLPGQEEELAKVLKPEEVEKLLAQGAISGEWVKTEPSFSGSKSDSDSTEVETLESLMEMTKGELLELAESRGVEVAKSANKETIAEAILNA